MKALNFRHKRGGDIIAVILPLAWRQLDIQLVERPTKGGGLYIAERGCDIKHPPLLFLGQT